MSGNRDISDGACLLALLMTPGIGVVTLNRLVLALHEAGVPLHAVVGSTASVLSKGLPVGLEWAVEPLVCCEEATVDRAQVLYQRVLDTGGQWVVRGDNEYPESLSKCMEYQAPPLLSVYGDVELLKVPGVSVVGSRDPSEHGLMLSKELAGWAVKNNLSVVSGGAQGIDITAHQAALDAGGQSCFLIPEGCLCFNGPKWLKDFLEGGRAVVVSQFIPDLSWSTAGALTRNRTIAALGEMVCVVDPGTGGGSRRTAEHALEYGKRTLVYAYDKANSSYLELMRAGAYPVISEIGQWDESYIEQHWRNRQQDIQEQVKLF